MEKQAVIKKIEKLGILNSDLADMMGIPEQELLKALNQKDIPDAFLQKIEKAIGKENIFIIPEIGDNNNFGDNSNNKNNNDSILMLKMLEAIERKDKQIDRLISIIESKTK